MPVLLDNIQFYHGPSKPVNRPHFAFNSSQKGSTASNTSPSGEQPALFNEAASSATEVPTAVPTAGFFSPAANTEEYLTR